MSDTPDKEATTHADLYQRIEQRSDNWEEADAVTGRPNDTPIEDPQPAPNGGNSTLGSRAKARKSVEKAEEKQVEAGSTEDKAVTSAATKAKSTRKARK